MKFDLDLPACQSDIIEQVIRQAEHMTVIVFKSQVFAKDLYGTEAATLRIPM